MVSLEAVASKVVEVSLAVKTGEKVWIHGWDHTLDIVSALAWECRRKGCQVLITAELENLWLRSMMELPLPMLQRVSPLQASVLKETDVYIFTLGPRRPIPWGRIPKERLGAVSVWLDERYDRSPFAREWAAIARSRGVRMLGIEATLATRERAKALGLNYEKLKETMLAGCVADYHEIAKRAADLKPLLGGEEEVHVTTPGGTDLRFRLGRRDVEVSDGLATGEKAEKGMVTFLPAGDVEVSVNEESAEGTIVYDVPVRVGNTLVSGLSLRLKNGRVVKVEAAEHRDVFEKYLEECKGDIKFAFFGFGLNPNLEFGYTQDDKVLGGVTLGFRGEGNDWWASLIKATVYVGDTEVLREGALSV